MSFFVSSCPGCYHLLYELRFISHNLSFIKKYDNDKYSKKVDKPKKRNWQPLRLYKDFFLRISLPYLIRPWTLFPLNQLSDEEPSSYKYTICSSGEIKPIKAPEDEIKQLEKEKARLENEIRKKRKNQEKKKQDSLELLYEDLSQEGELSQDETETKPFGNSKFSNANVAMNGVKSCIIGHTFAFVKDIS